MSQDEWNNKNKKNNSDVSPVNVTPTNTNFTVTYSGNGSTGGSVPTDSNAYSSGSSVTAASNSGSLVYLPSGTECKKFGGWNTKADGTGTTYTAGIGTFTITANTTLYAYWSAFSIRDTGPAGGYIIYDKGSFSDSWRYLEAAPASTDTTTYVWGGYGTTTGATGTAVGTGKQNTAVIVAQFGTTDPVSGGTYAAKVCNDLSVTNGGITFTGWFLPSQDEINLMCNNLYTYSLGGFVSNYYWSSYEQDSQYTWSLLFTNAYQWFYDKTTMRRVRACREF
jgi:hypothetical protein